MPMSWRTDCIETMIWIHLLDYSNHRVTVSRVSRMTGWIFGLEQYWIGTAWQIKSHTKLYSHTLVLYESCVTLMCIYLHTYTINDNICYLLFVTDYCIMKCTGFVFRLEIIHWVCSCLNPPLYPFSPGIKLLELIATLCSSIWSCEVPLAAHLYGNIKIGYASLRYVIHI